MARPLGLIPGQVLIDRRRYLAREAQPPRNQRVDLPPRGKTKGWSGPLASLALHVLALLAALGVFNFGGPVQQTRNLESATAEPDRAVQMVYLDPPAPPPPLPEPEQQQPEPEQPVETTPPSQAELPPPAPETDDVLSPAPADETAVNNSLDPAGAENGQPSPLARATEAEPNLISEAPVLEDGPESLAAAAEPAPASSQEEEARRIFGRPTSGDGSKHNALPWASDSTCVPAPKSPDPSSPVVLDSISGQVFDRSGRPLSGAHLQLVGTKYNTFSNSGGFYTLSFDVSLVANCRVQVVRVSAPGYRGRDLYLAMGVGDNNVWLNR